MILEPFKLVPVDAVLPNMLGEADFAFVGLSCTEKEPQEFDKMTYIVVCVKPLPQLHMCFSLRMQYCKKFPSKHMLQVETRDYIRISCKKKLSRFMSQ